MQQPDSVMTSGEGIAKGVLSSCCKAMIIGGYCYLCQEKAPVERKRTDADYEIESLTKGMAVLEALEGTNFEPVSSKRIRERTQLSKDTVERCLKTFRLRGWAVQNDRGEWMVGKRFIRIGHAAAGAFPEDKNSGAPEFKGPFLPVSY
jgi:biotin operon repressor